MRDRRLEQNITRVEAYIERWRHLSQFLDRGFQGENFTGEEEGAFLELKSLIAQEHELLMTTLGSEADRDDKTLRLMNSVPSLQAFTDLPEGMAKKIGSDWHATYLALQALLGRLKGRQIQLANISTFRVSLRNVFANPLVILFVTVAAVYGVYKFAEEVVPKLIELGERQK